MQPEEKNYNYVELVNEQGETIGYEEKLKAHQEGLLHKAFSIFIVNDAGEMLLQQRAYGKYHFAGLWSNTCCSHPRPQENLQQAAHRRLREEMGFDTPLNEAFSFVYQAKDAKSGLYEHEWDTIFIGTYAGTIAPDAQEVQAYRWVKLENLYEEIQTYPDRFSEWFKQGIELLKQKHLLPS